MTSEELESVGSEILKAEQEFAKAVRLYRSAYYNRKIVLSRVTTEGKQLRDEKDKVLSESAAERIARSSAAYTTVVSEECLHEESMINAQAKVDKLKRDYALGQGG